MRSLSLSFGRSVREPHGRLGFTGGKTALIWNGALLGGISGGERAGAEVSARINERRIGVDIVLNLASLSLSAFYPIVLRYAASRLNEPTPMSSGATPQ